jgi:hypothetical protein
MCINKKTVCEFNVFHVRALYNTKNINHQQTRKEVCGPGGTADSSRLQKQRSQQHILTQLQSATLV